jgi:hypothetical protein
MEKKKMVVSIVLIVWFLALVFTFYYLYTVYNSITTPTSIPAKLNSQSIELYSLSPFGSDELNTGGEVSITKGDIIPLTVKNVDYSIKFYDINYTSNSIELIINDFLSFSIKPLENKKLDLDGDNYYDLLIILKDINNGKANLYIKSIYEKKDVGDRLDEALLTIKQNSAIQSKVIILVGLFFIIILVLYYIKAYLAPAINLKRRTAREKPSSVMNYIIGEFNNSKRAGNDKDARKIANRAISLYKHMNDDEKREFRSNIKTMERYIN